MARLVLGQAEVGGLELRIHLPLVLFPKLKMFLVASPAACAQVVPPAETPMETQK